MIWVFLAFLEANLGVSRKPYWQRWLASSGLHRYLYLGCHGRHFFQRCLDSH